MKAITPMLLCSLLQPFRAVGKEVVEDDVYVSARGVIFVLDPVTHETTQTFFTAEQPGGNHGELFVHPTGRFENPLSTAFVPGKPTLLVATSTLDALFALDLATDQLTGVAELPEFPQDLIVASVPGGCVVPPASPPMPSPTPPALSCTGDCNRNGLVTVDEIVRAVDIASGALTIDACPAFDTCLPPDCVRIGDLVTSVNHALTGCPL